MSTTLETLEYQPKTGQPCTCREGQERDNCPQCEGTGMRIDFAAIRSRRFEPTNTIAAFCERNGIRLRRAERVDRNPHMEDSENMDHWKVQLEIASARERTRRRMTVHFSMGFGHNGKQPELEEIINALASDSTVGDQTFEEFCSEFGYDEDSRKAERTYKACLDEAVKLKRFLGSSDLWNELVFNTERL